MADLNKRDGDVADWWRTSIIEMEPGRIAIRGRPIESLIGTVGFVPMIWLMVRGEMPRPEQAALLEAALVSAVDHGPQAPSIAAARMAATCGVGLNSALATGVNMLGDVHGGAGEQMAAFLLSVSGRMEAGAALSEALEAEIARFKQAGGRYLPGFGHRFHKPTDPRAPRLLELCDAAQTAGVIEGRFLKLGRALGDYLEADRGRAIPMNVDGATAIIFSELGFPPPLARGLFCLSRSVGLVAHAWEQMQQGGRNKGPTPPGYLWTYDGLPQSFGPGSAP